MNIISSPPTPQVSYPAGVHTPNWSARCARELYIYGEGGAWLGAGRAHRVLLRARGTRRVNTGIACAGVYDAARPRYPMPTTINVVAQALASSRMWLVTHP